MESENNFEKIKNFVSGIQENEGRKVSLGEVSEALNMDEGFIMHELAMRAHSWHLVGGDIIDVDFE